MKSFYSWLETLNQYKVVALSGDYQKHSAFNLKDQKSIQNSTVFETV